MPIRNPSEQHGLGAHRLRGQATAILPKNRVMTHSTVRPPTASSKRRGTSKSAPRAAKSTKASLLKCPTGIRGLDDLTFGGLPCGRATLVCGGPGSGKTLLGMEFLARGARQFGENGVFIAFEERPTDLALNTDFIGLGVADLVARNRLVIDQISVDNENMETGEYDLEGALSDSVAQLTKSKRNAS